MNQRALIDKVLARYSGEFTGQFIWTDLQPQNALFSSFTVFRELLQNSSDAGAKNVQIHFETRSYLDKQAARSGQDVQIIDDDWKLPDLKTAHVMS